MDSHVCRARVWHRGGGSMTLTLAVTVVLVASTAVVAPRAAAAEPEVVGDPAGYVDPLIGTSGGGNVYPGAVLPFGMAAWSPVATTGNQTSSPGASGQYSYGVTKVRGFSLTHMSGTGCAGGSGDIPIFPHVGIVDTSPSADVTDAKYASTFWHPGAFLPLPGSISDKVAQITANGENAPAGEVKENLNDGSAGTKWLVFESTGWVQYQLSEPVAVTRYALTSANDAPSRDPRDWTLQGSQDGQTWTTLDAQTDQSFAQRFQTKQYEITNTTPYLHYRLDITRNSGATIVQLAEFELSDSTAPPPPPPPSDETAMAGYYRLALKSGATAELTVTPRTGSGRFTFPADQPANVLFRVSNSQVGSTDAAVNIDVANNRVTGQVDSGGFCGNTSGGTVNRRHYYSLYFAAEFDRPFTGYGAWVDGTLNPGSTSASGGEGFTGRAGKGSGGYVSFDTSGNQTVNVRVGISYVSAANAQANLDAENPSPGAPLDAVRASAYQTWKNELSKIRISGGTDDQRTIFYTALYHALLQPSLFSDVNGEYSGSDLQTYTIEPGQGAQYGTFSGWDVYRGQVQLLALLEPEIAGDYAQSLLNFARQRDGEWDRWLHNQGKTSVMAGDPSASAVAGMHAFGAANFDLHGAFDSLVTAATVPTANDLSDAGCIVNCNGQRPSLDRYMALGYVPNEDCHCWGSAGETLEDAVADYALANLAYRLGDMDAYETFLGRAESWKNVFNPDAAGIGYIQRRNSDGGWVTPFSPTSSAGFAEGNSARYTWMIYHDVAGLAQAMGGSANAINRLDRFFRFPDGTWAVRGGGASRYDPTNEPDIQAPWLYNYLGAPWKTQETVRQIVNTVFTSGTDGIPGNDDLGTMSSWYVWAAMGLYPQIPSRAELVLAAPLFPHIEIRRGNGVVITIDGPGAAADNRYIQNLSVNGRPTIRTWVPESLVRNGGTLAYALGDAPNTTWGTGAADAPPGMGFFDRSAFLPPLNPDAINTVTAGSSVPLKFSLAGDKGIEVLAAGSPSFQPTNCATGEPLSSPTAATSSEPFYYNGTDDVYVFSWKTNKSWAGTCARIDVTLTDGSSDAADFAFR